MERVPRTGASVYCQPPPLSDLLPVVASASAEPVPATGLPAVVPAVLRPHVATVHAAHMALLHKPCATLPRCSVVGGIDG